MFSASPPVCAFYQRNACARGDQCRFYHPAAPAPTRTRTTDHDRRTLCAHFVAGGCRFGALCRDRHSPLDSPPVSGVPKSPSSPVCPFFQQGGCRFGAACRLQHIVAVDTPSSSAPPDAETAADVRRKVRYTPWGSDGAGAFGGCKFFAKGTCTKGTACPFPHVSDAAHVASPIVQQPAVTVKINAEKSRLYEERVQSNLSPEQIPPRETLPKFEGVQKEKQSEHSTEQLSENESVSRQILACDVEFAAGAAVSKITTAFESARIALSNISKTMTQAELITLVEAHGPLRFATLVDQRGALSASGVAEYLAPEHAAAAVRALHGAVRGGATLSVHLDLRRGASGAAALLSNKVKLTWFAPSRIAWAHYPTLAAARAAAERLDGTQYEGRAVAAAVQTPTRGQTRSFSVALRGLPEHVTHARVLRWCAAPTLALGPPAFDAAEALAGVRRALSAHGVLVALDVLPTRAGASTAAKAKATAFAQFADADAAAAAVRALHRVPQGFLRNSALFAEVVHAAKGALPRGLYAAVRAELVRLAAALPVDGCKLRFYDAEGPAGAGEAPDRVGYRIYGADARAVGRTRAQLERILEGEMLVSGERADAPLWDEYFEGEDGRAFLDACSGGSAGESVYVKTDPRTRVVRLFGADEARRQVRTRILVRVAIVKATRHTVAVEKELLAMVLGGWQALQEAAAPATLSLDVVARTLAVRGSDEDVERVRRAIGALAAPDQPAVAAPGAATAAECPVCFCDATDATVLPCGHAYCRACLRLLLLSSASSASSGLRCILAVDHGATPPQGPCGAPIPMPLLRALLSPAEESAVVTAAFLAHVHARPDEFRYCPTPDCPVLYRAAPREGSGAGAGAGTESDTVLQCPACAARICPACHCEFHEGVRCAEHRAGTSAGDAAFARWREENGVKACPGCAAALQKNGGCNHITCARCRTHICWVCMATFTDEDSGGGVYAHMQRVHGGFGG